MPTVIQGFQILTKPADTQNESFPILITVPAAAPGNTVQDTIFILLKLLKLDAAKLIIGPTDELSL